MAYAESREDAEFAEKKEGKVRRRGIVALGRQSPPFAKGAKDGAPSSSFVGRRKEGNSRAQALRGSGQTGVTVPQIQRPTAPASLLRRAGQRYDSLTVKRAGIKASATTQTQEPTRPPK